MKRAPALLRQWCRRCQTASLSLPCAGCDGLVCAADEDETLGDLCDQCAALALAEDEEG